MEMKDCRYQIQITSVWGFSLGSLVTDARQDKEHQNFLWENFLHVGSGAEGCVDVVSFLETSQHISGRSVHNTPGGGWESHRRRSKCWMTTGCISKLLIFALLHIF